MTEFADVGKLSTEDQ